ncbi:MAG: hypothetical protein ACLRZ9_02900 [Eubacterium sp.]
MKQIIIIMGMAVIALIVSMTLLSKESRMDRQDELNRAVSAAVKQTVDASQIYNQKEITSDKEMVAQFIQIMSTNMNSDSDVSIEVMGVNYKEGMLDVLVTEKFKYYNGKNDTVSVRKCAIYE